MSGLPNRSNRWSASMAEAPPISSSAGWPMNIRVPCHLSFMATMALAVPTQAVMWMSWPQLWATGLMRPLYIWVAWLA